MRSRVSAEQRRPQWEGRGTSRVERIGPVRYADSSHGHLQTGKHFLVDRRCDLGAISTIDGCFVHDDHSPDTRGNLAQPRDIEGHERAKIRDRTGDTLGFGAFRGAETHVHRRTPSDEDDVTTVPGES